jgi:hypothetical protein
MNIKSSSIVTLSYLQYSNAYELDYNSYVIIVIYELVYSLYAMILTCITLCLIIHMICMSRSRARVEMAVRCSFRFAYILACRSVGSKSRGIWVVPLYTVWCSSTWEPSDIMVSHG